jgi:2-amino-4-hydroxy-6-hydroxymethyldihydropteridine diphosphokinase
MKYANVFLGLGSNIGDRNEYLRVAIELLQADEKVYVVQESSVIETEPIGEIAEGLFLNQVIEIETEYEPLELLRLCVEIEQSQGRTRGRKWESRTIDIDILFFGEQSIETKTLHVPHPAAHERQFVLIPLAEIAPLYVHPNLKQPIEALLGTL